MATVDDQIKDIQDDITAITETIEGLIKSQVTALKFDVLWGMIDKIERDKQKKEGPDFADLVLDVLIGLAISYGVPFIIKGVSAVVMKKLGNRMTSQAIKDQLLSAEIYHTKRISAEVYKKTRTGIINDVFSHIEGVRSITSSITKTETVSYLKYTMASPSEEVTKIVDSSVDFFEELLKSTYDEKKDEFRGGASILKNTIAALSYEKIKVLENILDEVINKFNYFSLNLKKSVESIRDPFLIEFLYEWVHNLRNFQLIENKRLIINKINDFIERYKRYVMFSDDQIFDIKYDFWLAPPRFYDTIGKGEVDHWKLFSDTIVNNKELGVFNIYNSIKWESIKEFFLKKSWANRWNDDNEKPDKVLAPGFACFYSCERSVYFSIKKKKSGQLAVNIIQNEVVYYCTSSDHYAASSLGQGPPPLYFGSLVSLTIDDLPKKSEEVISSLIHKLIESRAPKGGYQEALKGDVLTPYPIRRESFFVSGENIEDGKITYPILESK